MSFAPDAPPSPRRRRLEHLAFFLADLAGGGAERMVVNLAVGLSERGVRVDLVLANAVGPYLTQVPDHVSVVDLKRNGVAAALPALSRYLRREAPQVLVSTLHHSSVVAFLAARLARRGTRFYIREANTVSLRRTRGFQPRRWLIARLLRWAYRGADGIITVSNGVADDLARHRGIPRSKLASLSNPVVTPDVVVAASEEPDHAWFTSDAAPVILGVGRLHPQKNFAMLLRAFANVRSERDARLVILGEGPERPDLQGLARELGVEDDVSLPGFVVNPFAYMARSSVFVLSSVFEGLPGALIQAMACGCPVVATDCPSGPAEILEQGRFGALVPPGDTAGLAAAIGRTLDAPLASETLRAASQRYAVDVVVDGYLAYLEDALGTADARRHTAPTRGEIG